MKKSSKKSILVIENFSLNFQKWRITDHLFKRIWRLVDEMEILFEGKELRDFEQSIDREWLESDGLHTYSSANIWGLNSRRRHGLFVSRPVLSEKYIIMLSHFQEHLIMGEAQWDLFTVEYDNGVMIPGFENQTGFVLDPFPTFIYKTKNVVITKSLFLVPFSSRLVVYYKVEGHIEKDSRLVIRPFVAYRPVDGLTKTTGFMSNEAFVTENHIRFLPTPDFPELFLFHSSGDFVNHAMWYHNFVYRNDPHVPAVHEDLLNPGFFEIPLQNESEIFFSAGFKETDLDAIKNAYQRERERRFLSGYQHPHKNEFTQYLLSKVENFRCANSIRQMFFAPTLPLENVRLSTHFFALRNLLRIKIKKEYAREILLKSLELFAHRPIEEILAQNYKSIQVDPFAPFAILLALYEYHSRFEDSVTLSFSTELVQNILQSILKNRLPYYRVKRRKYLECQFVLSDYFNDTGELSVWPPNSDFLVNIFWVNGLKIALYLLKLNGRFHPKYEKISQKVLKVFREKYAGLFNIHKLNEFLTKSLYLHPSMILVLTAPYLIFNEKEARIFYSVLEELFLNEDGVEFTMDNGNSHQKITSPILAGEYLKAWNATLSNHTVIPDKYVKIREGLDRSVREGILGYIPDILKSDDPFLRSKNPASSLATAETLFFAEEFDKFSG